MPLGRTQSTPPALEDNSSAQAPIEKLPPEIMECIFLLCQPFYDDFLPTWPSRKSLEWISVACVSRRWRFIATSYPMLWCTIELCYNRPADLGRMFLKRSRNAPLTVFFASKYRRSSSSDIAVLQEIGAHHCDRLVALHVDVAHWRSFIRVYDLLDGKASHLESLSILLHRNDYDTSKKYPRIGPDAFAAQLSNVRRLAFRQCTYWQLGPFARLTHLAVCTDSYGDDAGNFWSLLQRSPQLEELVVLRCRVLNGDLTGFPILPLPHLRRLQLSGDVRRPSLFLARLNIPETCGIWINWYMERLLDSASPLPGSPSRATAQLMRRAESEKRPPPRPLDSRLWGHMT
ncbi:hypothetical protein K525DRAFT_207257 [Schizophyllum commune Loenen D]|nr:hypothetical protein K525DRAFT_207257 [Schizophyllum commune Loenen D]